MLTLLTGRTHQTRATMAAEGWPVDGDPTYVPMANYLHDHRESQAETRAATEEWEGSVEREGDDDGSLGLVQQMSQATYPSQVSLISSRV